MQDKQRLAGFLLEGHRGERTVLTFLIGSHKPRMRRYFEVPAEERHRLRALVAELETIPASDTDIRLAGKQVQT